jgi:hypothetical protein
MMRENLHIPPKPDLGSTQSIMDYTTVPGGLCIKGKMWTGQATTFTERCPKCGRIGVVSVTQNDKRVMVHRGRVAGDVLEGIDYCEFMTPTPLPPLDDRRIKNDGRLMEDGPSKVATGFLTTVAAEFLTTVAAKLSRSLAVRLKWILHVWL